jgi:hypothetical protein
MPPTPHNFMDIKIYTVSSRTTSIPNIKIKLYDYINYVKIIVEFYIVNINICQGSTSTWSSAAADKNPAAAVIFDRRRRLRQDPPPP